MEHTPGPWKAHIWKEGDEHQGNRIYAAAQLEIASLSYTSGPEDADAALIAAAPALLEACKALVSGSGRSKHDRAAARAAIDSATTVYA